MSGEAARMEKGRRAVKTANSGFLVSGKAGKGAIGSRIGAGYPALTTNENAQFLNSLSL